MKLKYAFRAGDLIEVLENTDDKIVFKARDQLCWLVKLEMSNESVPVCDAKSWKTVRYIALSELKTGIKFTA